MRTRANALEIVPDDDDFAAVELDSLQEFSKQEWRDVYREIIVSLGGIFREYDFEVAWAQFEAMKYGKRLN